MKTFAAFMFTALVLSACAPGGLKEVQTFDVGKAGDHRQGLITYSGVGTPPSGGAHNPVWQNCGVYNKPLASEHVMHSLEHGAVWFSYRPDLAAGEVEKLGALVQGQSKVLVSPYRGQKDAVVATAWGVQKGYAGADPELKSFLSQYLEKGAPENGALCSGGTDVVDSRSS